jgi:hypothetical protein
MPLEKLTITNVDSNDSFEVLFNPNEYTLEKRTPWREHETPGLDLPSVEFVAGERMSLAMELFFDTSDERTDVREHTNNISNLTLVNAELHRPPICLVTWGSLNFQGVLEHVVSRYTMFLSDGTPVRAVLAVTFREYRSAEEQTQQTPRESADHTKRRIVREGDTLQLIASREYNNASEWRRIARANRIADPLELTPGQELVIPPLP